MSAISKKWCKENLEKGVKYVFKDNNKDARTT